MLLKWLRLLPRQAGAISEAHNQGVFGGLALEQGISLGRVLAIRRILFHHFLVDLVPLMGSRRACSGVLLGGGGVCGGGLNEQFVQRLAIQVLPLHMLNDLL